MSAFVTATMSRVGVRLGRGGPIKVPAAWRRVAQDAQWARGQTATEQSSKTVRHALEARPVVTPSLQSNARSGNLPPASMLSRRGIDRCSYENPSPILHDNMILPGSYVSLPTVTVPSRRKVKEIASL